MFLEELGHAEGPDLLGAEDRLHFLVWGEELLVFWVLQVVLLIIIARLGFFTDVPLNQTKT